MDEDGYLCYEYSPSYPKLNGIAEYISPEWLVTG
jgi:hypothetical protein